MVWDATIIVFLVIVLLQLFFFLVLAKFLFSRNSSAYNKNLPKVSVIVSVYNEADHLEHLIHVLMNQVYPTLEVVVIDDGSTDSTPKILDSVFNKFQNLTILKNTVNLGKKKSLTKAISAAKYDQLLFTDGDCMPVSKDWIKSMMHCNSPEADIILGYGPYKHFPGFLNALIRFETAFTAFQYFGFAHIGFPYMGVGRNLAYSKTLFRSVNGYSAHDHIISGDDDLFVGEVATNDNTSICLDNASFVYSVPKTSWSSWFRQKRRHITTANHYKWQLKVTLSLFYLLNILFWCVFFLALLSSENVLVVLSIFGLRLIITSCIYRPLFKKLREKSLLFFFPVLELCLVLVQAYLFIANIVSKPKSWS